ncbi:MAG: ThiF family adenylyltransferase [Pseudolysinimonas sp.]
MSNSENPRAVDWQRAFADELQEVAVDSPGTIRVVERRAIDRDGMLPILISLPTEDIQTSDGGLHLDEQERFLITVPANPFVPPNVEVGHRRFAGFPHVLAGSRLCIYLDPSSEWDPRGGARAFLDRLWCWLEDAAAGRFDGHTALYQAVGGVTSTPTGVATVVVREELAEHHSMAYVVSRSPLRVDLTLESAEGAEAVPIWHSVDSLPFGVSSDLRELASLLDDPQLERNGLPHVGTAPKLEGILTTLKAAADRNLAGAAQLFVLSVAHPRGGPPHLLAGALANDVADGLRGTKNALDLAAKKLPIAWYRVSDERPSVTTRRDSNRPVRRLAGSTVLLWGCGGLGSWIAEFLVRAGVARLVLCDPGIVTGGLLVRQAYEELDVGNEKAVALAAHLRRIQDSVEVAVEPGHQPADLDDIASTFDLIIDATANLAVSRRLASIEVPRRAVVAQVATDRDQGALGIATIWPPTAAKSAEDIDAEAGEIVRSDNELEAYHQLWGLGNAGGGLVPTRGCSIPTFHGSAADLSAVAGGLLSLIAGHLGIPLAGVHLMALPHSGLSCPPHRFIEISPSG